MEVNALLEAISTFGFPVIMCLILFAVLLKMQEKHAEESKNMSEAINNNTLALVKLTAMLEKEG